MEAQETEEKLSGGWRTIAFGSNHKRRKQTFEVHCSLHHVWITSSGMPTSVMVSTSLNSNFSKNGIAISDMGNSRMEGDAKSMKRETLSTSLPGSHQTVRQTPASCAAETEKSKGCSYADPDGCRDPDDNKMGDFPAVQRGDEVLEPSSKHENKAFRVTHSLRVAVPETSPERGDKAKENEFHTPKSMEHRIPELQLCPPAPKKPKSETVVKRKLKPTSCLLPALIKLDNLELLFGSVVNDSSSLRLKKARQTDTS